MSHDALLQLAANALGLAVAGRDEEALGQVAVIAQDHGGDGLVMAMHGWCDQLAAAHPVSLEGADAYQPQWRAASDGGVRAFGDLGREDAWAGQFASARAAMDHPQTFALITALPWHDADALGAYVATLLLNVAATLSAIADGRFEALAGGAA
jgi:hypothetical protein